MNKTMNKTPVFQRVLHKSGLYLKKYSPVALSCVASVGVIVTVVTAVKATPKAVELIRIDSRQNHDGDPYAYTKKEAFVSAWKCYIPTALFGLSTVVCILGASAMNCRQQAALSSAYVLLNNSYKEYKEKLREIYGEEANQNIIDTLVKDKAENTNIFSQSFFGVATLNFEDETEPIELFYDAFSNRYFESAINRVLQAEYHLNRNFMLYGQVSLNNFYEFLGITQTDYGDTVGWSAFNGDIYWIDFNHYKTTLKDGHKVFVIEMVFEPNSDWLDDI